MTTNAQAALIAAASFMSNTPVGYPPAAPIEVTALASQWVEWLDRQDTTP